LSAAIRVEPEPRNGSTTMSPRLVRPMRASSRMAVGLTVGWSLRPRRASDPSDDAAFRSKLRKATRISEIEPTDPLSQVE
jgi:hypothetical protein